MQGIFLLDNYGEKTHLIDKNWHGGYLGSVTIRAGDDFGFDCFDGYIVACRACCHLVKNGGLIIIADENLAIAA